MENIYATVDDLIKILQKASDNGLGDYVVTCNQEYYLATKEEEPLVNEDKKAIDLGGYC